MRSWHVTAVCLAISLVTGGTSRIAAQERVEDKGPIVLAEKDGELRIRAQEGLNLGMLLKGCQLYLEDTLLFLPQELQAPLEWEGMTTKKSELWDRLQPILLTQHVYWTRLSPDLIALSNAQTIRRGELISQARFVNRQDLLSGEAGQAEIVTTFVPLRYLGVRSTFTSLRQYFTNQQYEAISHIDDANALLMTGTGKLLREFVLMLEELDRPTPVSECRFRVYPLEHRDVDEVVEEVKQFVAEAKGLEGSQRFSPTREVFLPLPNRKEVLMYARPETIELVESLIKTLDR
ncbi:MAG: secretin N-terminal domain-containing protein [Planctomycetota bacterium]